MIYTMWANESIMSAAPEGGLFDIRANSTTSNTDRGGKRPSSVIPVTIKQVLENADDSRSVFGVPVSMMTVVGIVKSIEITSTKIIFTVEDWTGTITAMLWLEEDQQRNKTPKCDVKEDTYCRMYGTKKLHEGTHCMYVYNISPIEQLSEITYHFLQVMYIPIKADKMKAKTEAERYKPDKMATEMPNNVSMSSYIYSNGLDANPQHAAVYTVLQKCTAEIGITSKGVLEQIPIRMSLTEIENVLEYLVNEGHLYNTIDEHHFRATELA